MKRKKISRGMLNLLVAVVMAFSLAIGFTTPAVAIPDCTNPQCLNPSIDVCAGTTFEDQLLIDNLVTCVPPPGTYLEGTDDEYTITRNYNFIQNPDPFGSGTDLEGTAPTVPGQYYYHVYCTKNRVVYGDSCSCASVGYIYVYGCDCNAEDFTVCVGDVLTEQDIIEKGDVSCTGQDCSISDIDWSAVNTSEAGIYEYTVTCYSDMCGIKECSADITVQECGGGCLCVAPDLVICQGYDLTEQDFIDAGATCPDPGCVMTLDFSTVNTNVPGIYTYTVNCDDVSCHGSVTVNPACVATAPDITMCQNGDLNEALTKALAGCSTGCDPNIDTSQVIVCNPGDYPYSVTCNDPCGGECGNDVAEGTIHVLPCVDVEIIEAAGYEKYIDNTGPSPNPAWQPSCKPGDPRMIVPISSDFGIKAKIGNCSGCILYDVTPYITIVGPAILIADMPDHWNLGNMEGGADADSTEAGWTLHCTGPGMVTVTVMVNECAVDKVCFDQRNPADLTVACASPCEVGTKCNPANTNNKFNVTATVGNTGDTDIRDAEAVLTAIPLGNVSIAAATKVIGTLAPGASVPLTWVVTCLGEGDVTFTVTASGIDKCGDVPLEETCTTMTRQRDVLIDVCAQKVGVTGECDTDCKDCITVSVGQLFNIVTKMKNWTNTDQPAVVTLNLPAGSQIVTGSTVRLDCSGWGLNTPQFKTPDLSVAGKATISLATPAPILCACCEVTITWQLVCTASTGGDCVAGTCSPYSVDAVVCLKNYSSLPCNPASVCQETKAALSGYLVGPFVQDCDCDDMVKVDSVAVGQYYDVKICLTNSGEADADNVQATVVISGNTTCTGGPFPIDFGTIKGGESKCLWLSEAIPCELQCNGEPEAIIQITYIIGEDENTCLEFTGPITDLCGLEIPQCEVTVEIINPVTSTEINQWEVFAVKARIDNCGTCSFEDVAATLSWTGAVELVEGSVNPVIIDLIEAPDEDCEEDCRFEEVTWMVRCIGTGDVKFDVCVEAADPHLQIKTIESTTIHQIPRNKAMVCVDILSPDNGSKYPTSEDFAITAKVTNLECCAPITIDKATINIGGIPFGAENIVVGDPMPAMPWVINPGESKMVTWTAHCVGSGLSWFNVHLEGISDEYEPVYVCSKPVSVWQYPAAHLEVTIGEYPETPIGTSTFDVTYTVTNTGEADATDVYAILSATPEGSVRIAPSDGGYSQYIGTIPGHGSEANSVTKTYSLKFMTPNNSTIKITASGNDEYGWHMKQACASTGSFVIEGGMESVEELTAGFISGPVVVDNKGWFYGVFFGDSNGLFGPFNATSPVSWAKMGGGPDYTGEVALMGAVIPNVSLTTAEKLAERMCYNGQCLWNPDCNSQCLCNLIEGKDVMVFIGHIISDTPDDYLADTHFFVEGGLLQIINGQLSGSFIKGNPQYGEWAQSLLGGQYCSDMASTAGLAIPAGFIESDEVTVEQLHLMTDLSIEKSSDTCCYTMGEEATFTVTVTNLGPSGATNVLVQDVLPAELSIEGYTATQGWYDETSGYWSVGDLANGGVATLTIVTTVNTVGEVCNRATVAGMDEHDPVMSNNSYQVCINATEPAPVEGVTLHLDMGQNLISLPLMPTVTNPVTALSGVNFDISAMMTGSSKTAWAFKLYMKGGAPEAGFLWKDGYGYWINVLSSGQTLPIAGKELPSGATLPPSYDVAGGWNLIGFKSTTAKLPSAYLAGIAGKYVMIYGYDNGAFYAVGSPGHAMLQPGFGYWLAVKVGDTGTIFP
jgi:uncharacterized repeat protein (TIGR01451 family)